ncbi:[FeFe] hydrogenase, group A [Natronincola peptidivorans]|uniref:[FeFe] hydrogenase, group A n=1 Tax=Natronincola peptidivorans TaxID=426128 RepID=A0A1I0BL16_9FIRM|nr:NADH-dependent [FeFe] hydrogenase, group A6 [Natronincola peptidivorans]SET07632.1 [FeFe] hydrogenase, group A [Natronincola peptidivorans]
MLTITIDGKQISTPKGTTILEAAKKAGIEIPTLCHHKDIFPPEVQKSGGCRICMVKDVATDKMIPSCAEPVTDGMRIISSNKKIKQARRNILESILENHLIDCDHCLRQKKCELMTLAKEFGLDHITSTSVKRLVEKMDISSEGINRDPQKCILCGRCVRVCSETQTADILSFKYDGFPNQVTPPFSDEVSPQYERQLKDTACVECGQCVTVCPTGALTEKSHEERVWEALKDPNKHVVAQTAPAIRVSIGEEFGIAPGGVSTGQMVASLKNLGFNKVFDTNFTADLTILEEGHEFIDRVGKGENLPMFTSCSPGWIKFMEYNYPEYLDNLSTCKSPQQMFGALAKSYYAKKAGIDPKDIFSVSLMPCTAKKFEASRPEMSQSGIQDVDAVLTTREFARMVKKANIDFKGLEEQEFDNPLGVSTGAAAIFGTTGGVMEAALRTAVEVITGKELGGIEFQQVRGYEGIKEATLQVGELEVKVAVCHGLSNARKLLEMIKNGDAFYHFVEVMSCPGGCIGGGGQPLPATKEKRQARMDAIYEVDKNLPLRKSHENPAVQELYKEFLGEPLGKMSHDLLHTEYTERIQNSTLHKAIKEAGLSDQLVFPLKQGDGKFARPVVIEGEEVSVGQKIAEANGFYGRHIYSGVVGKVIKIKEQNDSRTKNAESIIIVPGKLQEAMLKEVSAAVDSVEKADGISTDSQEVKIEELSVNELREKIAGIGISHLPAISNTRVNTPLFEKGIEWEANHKDTLVINLAGTNNLVTKDHRLALENINQLLKGIKVLLKAFKLERCVIAACANDPTVINLLSEKVQNDEIIEVVTVADKYPQSKESMLIQKIFASGKSIEACMITDVETVVKIYNRITAGVPNIDTVITVDGLLVKDPRNYRVRLGVSLKSVLMEAGVDLNQIESQGVKIYLSKRDGQLREASLEEFITDSIQGVLILAEETKLSKLENYDDCVHCGRCVENCPMELYPNKLSIFAETKQLSESRGYNVEDCIGCSICAFVCPSNRPISSMIKQTKDELKVF